MLMSENEGFPNSLVEALYVGRPVIATRTGGTEEIIDGGRNGIAVNVGDVAAAAGAILHLAGERDIREQMGARGREFAQRRYSEAASLAALMTAYASVAGPLAATALQPESNQPATV